MGAAACQQSVGDYLFHCHVAHHYVSGMWAIWRVYNTLQAGPPQAGAAQDGLRSQDGLPPLLELPDRTGAVQPAVDSAALVGRNVDWKGKQFAVTQNSLAAWVERQLPAPGKPRGYDASVLDWRKEGNLYLNEQETDQIWPGYVCPALRPARDRRWPLIRSPASWPIRSCVLILPSGRPVPPITGLPPSWIPFQQGTDPPSARRKWPVERLPGRHPVAELCHPRHQFADHAQRQEPDHRSRRRAFCVERTGAGDTAPMIR